MGTCLRMVKHLLLLILSRHFVPNYLHTRTYKPSQTLELGQEQRTGYGEFFLVFSHLLKQVYNK